MVEPLLVGVRDAASRLGLGRDATYALVREGRLRSVHVNRRVLIPLTELAAFVTRELGGGDGAGTGAATGEALGP